MARVVVVGAGAAVLTLGSGVVRIAFGATCPIMLRPPARFAPMLLVLEPGSPNLLELVEVRIGPRTIRVSEDLAAALDLSIAGKMYRCFRFPRKARVDARVDISVIVKNVSATGVVDAIVMVQGTGRSVP